jgi:DUF1680 family protein
MLLQKGPEYFAVPRGTCTDPQTWKRVALKAAAPLRGVSVREGGLFHAAMRENIAYLLRSFSVDHMLHPFRVRAGQPDAPGKETQVKFWDTRLEGANAGRFLMGAGNTLRWMEDAELRRRMDAVVDGIEACRAPDGYIHGFPHRYMISGDPGCRWGEAQRSSYARAWVTHGLIDASLAGNPKALPLIRAGHDWFNRCPYLPELQKAQLWAQGHVAGTRMYFTALGKPEDLQVAERYYVVDEWMNKLAARDPGAIWLDGLGNPHCYEITVFEAYLDHYLATGERRYLEAMEGAWEMMRRHWLHVGGSIALCEGLDYPPDSRFVDPKKHTGEFCGSVFWAKFNQRFHLLRPDDERYVAEIERSIYNVALANQAPGLGLRYHTRLEGHKEKGTQVNTCCEGQGTRFLASLPEYIYSLAADGVYVNLFEPSSLAADLDGRPIRLRMETSFPRQAQVRLAIEESPGRFRLSIRAPWWCTGPMQVRINGQAGAAGQPGTYLELERDWRAGDAVEFQAPIGLRLTRYRGADNFNWHIRAAIEYGPVLLAVVGTPGDPIPVRIAQDLADPAEWLEPVSGQPLRWRVRGQPEYLVMPYWEVAGSQHFSCFPVLSGRE